MRSMEPLESLYADRSDRGKLRFTGPQRAWFLHQILTQAFEDMAPGDAREAAMLTAHGRMVAYMESMATTDALFMHFEPELKNDLPDAIRRYVFATQVEIEDVTDRFGLILVTGSDSIREIGLEGVMSQQTHALGAPAHYLWVEAERKQELIAALRDSGGHPATEERLEAIRIANGAPRWGRDMDTKTFPQEAGIDSYAVHYDKGCYVGQEAMAKIHFRGKVNRRLARVEAEAPLAVGEVLSLDGQKVGSVTSVIDGKALAMVRFDLAPGTEVEAAEAAARVLD